MVKESMSSVGDLMTEALSMLRGADLRIGSGDLEDVLVILPDRRAVPVQMKAFTSSPRPSTDRVTRPHST